MQWDQNRVSSWPFYISPTDSIMFCILEFCADDLEDMWRRSTGCRKLKATSIMYESS